MCGSLCSKLCRPQISCFEDAQVIDAHQDSTYCEDEALNHDVPSPATVIQFAENCNKTAKVDLRSIYRGDFSLLPEEEPSGVRIFLSATSTDLQLERDFMMELVYTDLRESIRQHYGYDLSVIDLHAAESEADALTNEFAIEQVEKCLKQSIGPAFIVLLGHAYGKPQLPCEINKSEFEVILKNSEEILYDGVNLFQSCYELDENDLGRRCCYKLKPIKRILKDSKDVWEELEAELLKALRSSVLQSLGESEQKKYFTSVIEEEILRGVIENANAGRSSLAFFRNIIYTEADEDEMKKKGFLDSGQDLQQHLPLKLRNRVRDALNENSMVDFKVSWTKTNKLDKQSEDTRAYLGEFREKLKLKMNSLIQIGFKSRLLVKLSDEDYEIIHHARLCQCFNKDFLRRDECTQKIDEYLNDDANRMPFVVYGPSGSGKSMLMANTVNGKAAITAIRFMGTSRQSSTSHSVLNSLIYQFKSLLKIEEPLAEEKDYLFKKILTDEHLKGQRVIICFDAIDQLDEQDYDLEWITFELPVNVKVIYSTLLKDRNILENFKNKLQYSNSSYMKVKQMGVGNGMDMLKEKLSSRGRDLQPKQWELMKACLNKSLKIFPLHVQLLCGVTCKWRSTYFPSGDESLDACVNIRETIRYLFKRFELQFGPILFSHFVFYLTILQNGVTESELADVLSLDDKVLNEVFPKTEPAIRRLPSGVLMRMLDEVKDYLVSKQSDEGVLLSWCHQAFYEVLRETYEPMFRRSRTRDFLLQNLIDYFNGEWIHRGKDYELRNGRVKIKKKAPRYTKSQEIRFKPLDDGDWIYNKRKLNEFVNVVLMLNTEVMKIDILTNKVFLNYQFMHAKAELQDLQFILDTHPLIETLHDQVNEKTLKKKADELLEISRVYGNIHDRIKEYPDSLLHEVISRSTNESHVQKLKNSVDTEDFTLVPLSSGLKDSSKKVLFTKDDCVEHFDIQWMFNSAYLLVKCYDEDSIKMRFINHEVGREIKDEIEITRGESSIQIVFLHKRPAALINFMNEFDGGIIYSADKSEKQSVYLRLFQSEADHLIRNCASEIEDAFLLSSTSLVLVYKTSFELINFSDYNSPRLVFESDVFEHSILLIQATVPKADVFVSDYDLVDLKILCVIFETEIEIYSYDPVLKIQHLVQVPLEYPITARFTDCGCIIDKQHSVETRLLADQHTQLNEIFRFLKFSAVNIGLGHEMRIEDIEEIQMMSVTQKNSDNKIVLHKMDFKEKINHLLVNTDPEDTLEIYDFKANLIVFAILNVTFNSRNRYVYLYNTHLNSVVKKIGHEKVINQWWSNAEIIRNKVIFDNGLHKRMFIYDIEKDEFNFFSFASKPIKWKLIDDRIIVQTEKAIKSVKSNEVRAEISNQMDNLEEKGEIYGFIDDEHLLVKQDDGEVLCIAVVKAENQEIVFMSTLATEPKCVNFNRSMIIITFFNYSEVYAIKREQPKISVAKIDESIVHQALWSSGIKVNFSAWNEHQFLISAYNWKDNNFQVIKYELSDHIEKTSDLLVHLANFDVKNKTPVYCITHERNFLVYLIVVSEEEMYEEHELTGRYCMFELRCVDIEANKCVSKSFYDMTGLFQAPAILPLPNEDEFIIHADQSTYFTFFKIDHKHSEFVRSDFELDNEIHQMQLINKNIFSIQYEATTWIYDLIKMHRIHVFNEPGIVYVMNAKYLINFHEKKIRIFEMKNEERKLMLTMPFHLNNSKRVKIHKNYLAVMLHDNKMLTFSLNSV